MIRFSRFGQLRCALPNVVSAITRRVPDGQNFFYHAIFVTPLNDVFSNTANTGNDVYNFAPVFNPAWEFAPIHSRIVFNEIGDGTNDFILRKIHLEALPDYRWSSEVAIDPSLRVELRSNPWRESTVLPTTTTPNMPRIGATRFDITQLNMSVRGTAINPFVTTLEAPSGTTHTQVFTTGSNTLPRESLTLIAPDNATFRRMKLTMNTKIVAVLRGITIQTSRYERKSWG